MKKRLIILSDLWGRDKSEWLIYYTQILNNYFDIQYYDCCELGEIDMFDYNEESLHKQFINGGINRAVDKLYELERQPVTILAFSIGGTIAWKYGLKSDRIDSLICVSSTRLRMETLKPAGKIILYFGEDDAYKPDIDWFNNMMLNQNFIKDSGHQFYKDRDFANELYKRIIEDNMLQRPV